MSRALKSRITKLELAATPASTDRVVVVFGRTAEEVEQQLAEKQATGEYREGDHVIHVRFVSPGAVPGSDDAP